MQIISGKIPVTVYPIFWVLVGLIGWINTFTFIGTLVWIGVILISVLVHEFGHALTAVAFGHEARIELLGLGGVTHRRGPKLKLWKEFIIVLNGPVAGFVLAYFCYKLHAALDKSPNTVLQYAVFIGLYVNIFWTVINLLPIQPLDGGHLLRIFLEMLFGFRGVKIALFLSMILSAATAMLFFVLNAFLVGALFLMLTFENFRIWSRMRSVTQEDQSSSLQEELKNAEKEYREGDQEEARALLEEIRKKSKRGMIYQTASEYLADLLNAEGEEGEAFEVLYPFKDQLSPDSLRLLHTLAYRTNKWKEAVNLGNRAYQYHPDYDTALINAFSHARMGQEVPAIGWLKRAISDGLPDLGEVLQRADFDPIREGDRFREICN